MPYDAQQIELKVQRRRRRMRSQLISVFVTVLIMAGLYFCSATSFRVLDFS